MRILGQALCMTLVLFVGCAKSHSEEASTAKNAANGPSAMECGDHWLALDVAFNQATPDIRIHGDSVEGEDEVVQTVVGITTNEEDGSIRYHFRFPDQDRSLSVDFPAGSSTGLGVYKPGADNAEINMSCRLI